NLKTTPDQPPGLSDLQLTLINPDSGTVKFDITVFIFKSTQGLSGSFVYNTDLFDVATITRLSEDYQSMLRLAIANPDATLKDLARLMTDDEMRRATTLREQMKKANLDRLKGFTRKQS
ncbi:MAG: condensation domain-containing protein, partial [Blastocatellia bacterium]